MGELNEVASEDPAAARGGHSLPRRFSSPGSDAGYAPRSKRRVRARTILAWALPAAAVVVGAVVFSTLQAGASRGYDTALAQMRSALVQAEQSQGDLAGGAAELVATTDVASAILAADTSGILSADARDALQSAADQAQGGIDGAHTASTTASSPYTEKPFWLWDLGPATKRLQEQRTDAVASQTRADDALEGVRKAVRSLQDAGSTALDQTVADAPAVEHANVSARTGDVIALRRAAQDLAESSRRLDQGTESAFTSYLAAVSTVRASNASELTEKAGPLYDRRLDVEAWARSISGGVLLDFDWGPTVNGFGDNGSAGGLTSWYGRNGIDPGHATITLSDSVAEQWPSELAQALVTHEVGHAISAKCSSLFDWRSRDANEAWATAWTLSWGRTADGNGVSLYGMPPQSLIDTAATCR